MSVYLLGIESSCDETAASVVRDGKHILSNVISSQIDIHALYGGVVPEIASRNHIERISEVVDSSLKEAGLTLGDIDAVAVTFGPGLVGPLLVGVSYAKALSFGTGKPLIGVNHIEGHISANYLLDPSPEPPFVCLVVSGGHTHLVNVHKFGQYEVLGMSMDDAAGEAFDKVARALGLGYPGGPKIDKEARLGDPEKYEFPRAHVDKNELDFSFSGLKSSVLNYLNSLKMRDEEVRVADVAASFQKAVVDVLVSHSMSALDESGIKRFALAGGVASNSCLRVGMEKACAERGIEFFVPPPILCTDNGAMIAAAGYRSFIQGKVSSLDLNAVPNLRLEAM
ncbi:MAG: tRNA (adenosine(37)-N6)-threonylcarbamoyltransferase complex transferase subunit TsaD [Lachnospiraceae bacterium]|nr:tRNA (adenosine(37)-N6)-threonylcarbamoyltransferase complex transferase subunit TsaD [Lachnospiraceae bacterium]